MGLKKLSQFMKFDLDAFLAGKELECNEVKELVDYETKKHLGTRVTAVITKDNTQYKTIDGKPVSNRYKTFYINVLKDVDVPIDAKIMPLKVVKATAYSPDKDKDGKSSQYKTELSVTCEDIRIIPQRGQGI